MENQIQEMNRGAVRQRERPEEAGPDITARLRRDPDTKWSETVAKRPQRQRKETGEYQAGRKRQRDQNRGRESEDVQEVNPGHFYGQF